MFFSMRLQNHTRTPKTSFTLGLEFLCHIYSHKDRFKSSPMVQNPRKKDSIIKEINLFLKWAKSRFYIVYTEQGNRSPSACLRKCKYTPLCVQLDCTHCIFLLTCLIPSKNIQLRSLSVQWSGEILCRTVIGSEIWRLST